MMSKITGGPTEYFFKQRILNKYDIDYYQCLETGFVQTEEPYWLDEAYSSAITKLDVGLVMRNEGLRNSASRIITKYFNADARFLDYAGGYGLFTRMMRDKGFDFYHTDRYCENIFAEYFDLENVNAAPDFELVTAFEIFEHLVNPVQDIERILTYSNNLLFTTEIIPQQFKDWWYISPETGQHIAFYTIASLQYLADKFGYNFYTDEQSTHLFTKTTLKKNPFQEEELPYLIKKIKAKLDRYFRRNNPERESLLHHDWDFIKNSIV
ncbi:class I SAM-dependent methyltransferase [Pedobacter soli]|uniref:Methyltransferase domain-containing protein n=1 Tax=Pedobacter soli TaxID=390242 RepID=A0A1G6UFB5_9SPHI|nr:class I SAM-dependent methyltransferase [Pedobacter soli]SDD39949.1 Methyltransferase domain-containing protein [Pedobacter soli]